MNNKLKNILKNIELLEYDNKNYNPKSTNKIILSLINDNKSDDNLSIELYSPTKKSIKEFLVQLGNYKKVHKNDLDKSCSICLEKYKQKEFKRILPNCKHSFHKKCIDKWFYINNNKYCPICYYSYNNLLNNCKNKSYLSL